jgi:hypothetical protein
MDESVETQAQTYSFEAANVRHEDEWQVWQEAKLPPGKMLMPGVVSHATNLVEHPALVADRILRYAAIVGRESVIGGTDCGLGAGSTPTSPGRSWERSPKARAPLEVALALNTFAATTGEDDDKRRGRGTDVVKAMILGAVAVSVGRLYVYGLAAAGAPGIVRLLEILENEIHICPSLLGVTSFAPSTNPTFARRGRSPGRTCIAPSRCSSCRARRISRALDLQSGIGAEDFQQCRNRARAITIAMLDGVECPRFNKDGQALQDTGLDGAGAHAGGKNGGAGTRQDRGKHRLIRRQLDGDIEFAVRDAERAQCLDEGCPCPGAILSQDPFADGQILDRKPLADRTRVVGAGDHYELIHGDQFDCEPGIREFLFRTFDKAEFDIAADYGVDNLGRITDGNHQDDARIRLVKLDQSRRQEMARYCLAGLDLETPATEPRELAHRKLQSLGVVDETARFVEQQLTSFGYNDTASHTMEQFRAELSLE